MRLSKGVSDLPSVDIVPRRHGPEFTNDPVQIPGDYLVWEWEAQVAAEHGKPLPYEDEQDLPFT